MENLILQWKLPKSENAKTGAPWTSVSSRRSRRSRSSPPRPAVRFKNGTNLGVGNPTNMWKCWETCGKTRGKHHWFNIVWIP